jgi:hypothetical protein
MSLSSKALLNCKTLFFNPQHYCTQAQRSCHGVTVWNVTAMLLDGTKLNVMRPSWVAENPAMEVAFHVDPGYGRRHVD